MSDPLPRRSRPPSTPPPGGGVPLVPILIAVVVLGFVIGAGLSLVGKRGPTPQNVVVTTRATTAATETPVTPAPTEAPASPEPTSRSPKPTSAPTEFPSATPAPAKTSRATPRATSAPSAAPTRAPATPAPVTAAPATPALATHAPIVTNAPARPPVAAVAAIPARATTKAAPASATPQLDAPAPSDDSDSEFAKLATAVVRQYIAAVARGDDATARAAFGSGAPETLAETGILNASTRIQHIEARSAGDNATVNVDLRTASGLYFGQYTVHRTSSGAALIANHAINKL